MSLIIESLDKISFSDGTSFIHKEIYKFLYLLYKAFENKVLDCDKMQSLINILCAGDCESKFNIEELKEFAIEFEKGNINKEIVATCVENAKRFILLGGEIDENLKEAKDFELCESYQMFNEFKQDLFNLIPKPSKPQETSKQSDYAELLKIAKTHSLDLPICNEGDDAITKFFEDKKIPDDVKLKAKEDLQSLKDAKPEDRDRMKKRLNYILNFPGWGAAVDERELKLREIIGDDFSEQVVMDRIKKEVARAKNQIDKGFEGLEQVKSIFIEYYLYELIKKYEILKDPNKKHTILPFNPICLDGPPGTGKTSIMKVISDALHLNLNTYRMETKPEASLISGRGVHWQGGGLPGFIADSKIQSKSNTALLLIDELEKGTEELINSLGSVLEVKSTEKIKDDYFDFSIPTPGIYFVATSNGYDLLPAHIKSRMTCVSVPGYDLEKKISIVKKLLDEEKITTEDGLAQYLVETYSYEHGLRELIKIVDLIKKKFVLQKHITKEELDQALVLSGIKKLNLEQQKIMQLSEQYEKVKMELLASSSKDTKDKINECRKRFVQISGKLNILMAAVMADKESYYENQHKIYKEFIMNYNREVNGLFLYHNYRLSSYESKNTNLTPDESKALKQRKLASKILFLKWKVEENELSIRNLKNLIDHSKPNYETKKRILEMTAYEKEREKYQEKILFCTLQAEILKLKTPISHEQRQKIESYKKKLEEYLDKYNLVLEGMIENSDPANKVRKKILKIQNYLIDLNDILKKSSDLEVFKKDGFTKDFPNPRSQNSLHNDFVKETESSSALNPTDLKGYVDHKIDPTIPFVNPSDIASSSSVNPQNLTGSFNGEGTGKLVPQPGLNSKDQQSESEYLKPENWLNPSSGLTRSNPNPNPSSSPSSSPNPDPNKETTETSSLEQHKDLTFFSKKEPKDLHSPIGSSTLPPEQRLEKAFIEHLDYKKRKNKTFEQEQDFWLADKLPAFHEKYPDGKEKILKEKKDKKNLETEKRLYLDWEKGAKASSNPNEITIFKKDGTNYIKITKQDKKLKMATKFSNLDDATITKMVEAQKRAGKSIIMVKGLCKENQSPEELEKGINNVYKFQQAAEAMGLKIRFDEFTLKKVHQRPQFKN